MNTTYLNNYLGHEIAYLPLGTVEWHGNHLPLETDVIVAEEIAKRAAQIAPGFILPGIYLGTYIDKDGLKGMAKHISKELPGEMYQTEPELFFELISSMVQNLSRDFKKIVIITGHAGAKQIEMLKKIEKENDNVIFVNPYESLPFDAPHAGIEETSILWACRPEQEAISRVIEIPDNDDYFKWAKCDPRTDASLKKRQKLLQTMVDGTIKKTHQR